MSEVDGRDGDRGRLTEGASKAGLPAGEVQTGERPPRYLLHLGLFMLTCITTARVGAEMSYGQGPLSWLAVITDPAQLLVGWPFALSLMGILFSHEMGHYIVARRHGVHATLPFFLPLPVGSIGTLGAVIGMPQARRRDALLDIGAGGPLAGLVVAIPVIVYGISISPVGPLAGGVIEGNNILYITLKFLVKGQYLPAAGVDVHLHQVAWAGWVGLFVTMLNLMPVGQLDGGHIAFAYLGNRQNKVSRWLHWGLIPMGVAAYGFSLWELSSGMPLGLALQGAILAGSPYLVWTGMLALMRRLGGGYHPPVDDEPLSPGRKRAFWLLVSVYLLIFTPIPLRQCLRAATKR